MPIAGLSPATRPVSKRSMLTINSYDKTGRVHWARHGGGPFTDYDFLAAQLERMNALAAKASSSTASSAPRQ